MGWNYPLAFTEMMVELNIKYSLSNERLYFLPAD